MLLVWIALGVLYVVMFGFTKELIRHGTPESRANLGAALWPGTWLALFGAMLARVATQPRKRRRSDE